MPREDSQFTEAESDVGEGGCCICAASLVLVLPGFCVIAAGDDEQSL